MIVASSAVVAILNAEPEREALLDAIHASASARMSAANYLETAIVVDGLGDPVRSRRLDEVLAALEVDIVAVTLDQAQRARQAYREFGKGSGHPAGLNFGDVFAYALATGSGETLLYKGNDFRHTDVSSAI